MKYEVIQLAEKTVVGVSVTSSNTDPEMGEKIANLWVQLYQTGIYESIKNKINERAIGLYTDYSENNYLAFAGNEVSKSENAELVTKTIPAGKYAKFSIHGHMVEAVQKAWAEIWQMDFR